MLTKMLNMQQTLFEITKKKKKIITQIYKFYDQKYSLIFIKYLLWWVIK